VREITVIIATRGRLEKLRRTLVSIPLQANGAAVHVAVACDADEATFHELGKQGLRRAGEVDELVLIPEQRGAVYCRNRLAENVRDAVLWATDDIVFKPRSIEAAAESLSRRFTEEDGVVGFNQVNHKHFNPTGVGIMGQAFLLRYPEKHLFFPGYFHFACQEIHWLATRLGKFHFEPMARLVHHHPSEREFREEMDQTHADARIFKSRDMALLAQRTEAGEAWGAE